MPENQGPSESNERLQSELVLVALVRPQQLLAGLRSIWKKAASRHVLRARLPRGTAPKQAGQEATSTCRSQRRFHTQVMVCCPRRAGWVDESLINQHSSSGIKREYKWEFANITIPDRTALKAGRHRFCFCDGRGGKGGQRDRRRDRRCHRESRR